MSTKNNRIIAKAVKGMKLPIPIEEDGFFHWKDGMKILGPKMLEEGGIAVVITATRSDGIQFYVKQTVKKGLEIEETEVAQEAQALLLSAAIRLNTHLDNMCSCRIPPKLETCQVFHYPVVKKQSNK